jgi:methionyl-tRNA synthetase
MKALEEGVSPAELCAKYHAIHKEIYDCMSSLYLSTGSRLTWDGW